MILRNYLYYTYESFWKTLVYVYVFYSIKCVFLISGDPHKIWKKTYYIQHIISRHGICVLTHTVLLTTYTIKTTLQLVH